MERDTPTPTRSDAAPSEPDVATNELWFEITSEGATPQPPKKPSGKFRLELRNDEPLAIGIQRVCLFELDTALYGLRHEPDRPKGVHEARKASKRIRAMLRLVRDAIGYPVYRTENVVLRDVARELSTVRSSAVLRTLAEEILATLAGDVDAEAAAHLIAELESRQHSEEVLVHDRQKMMELATTLLTARARFATWPLIDTDVDGYALPRHRIPDDFDAVAGGLHRVYRRGRKMMRIAETRPSVHSFHQWRKRVKYLRYQIESLHLIWPPVMDGMAHALETLAESLGVEHDHAELGQLISGEPWLVPDPAGRRVLLSHIAQRRLELQQQALTIGRRLYHEAPDAFTERLRSYWDGRDA